MRTFPRPVRSSGRPRSARPRFGRPPAPPLNPLINGLIMLQKPVPAASTPPARPAATPSRCARPLAAATVCLHL